VLSTALMQLATQDLDPASVRSLPRFYPSPGQAPILRANHKLLLDALWPVEKQKAAPSGVQLCQAPRPAANVANFDERRQGT
jgi:hypothetical protein